MPSAQSLRVSAQVLLWTAGQSNINFQSRTLGFVAVSHGTYVAANAEHLALIEMLAADINSTSQANSMRKLSQPFSFKTKSRAHQTPERGNRKTWVYVVIC